MINIITNGNRVSLLKIKFAKKCILCNCTFEFELEDLELSCVLYPDGNADVRFSIRCPQCQDKVTYDYFQLCDMISDKKKDVKNN